MNLNQVNPKVVETVNGILHDKFEIPRDQLIPSAHLKEDLKLDSLDFVDMFILLEEQMSQSAQNIDFTKIQTLGDIYKLVSDLSQNRS